MSRLYYSAYAVKPSRLPSYVADDGQQVEAWTQPVGGTQIVDLTLDADGLVPIDTLETDATGSFGVFIEPGTAPDDLVWFHVVGSSAPRFAVGPSSGGFITRDSADAAYLASTPPQGAPGGFAWITQPDGSFALQALPNNTATSAVTAVDF